MSLASSIVGFSGLETEQVDRNQGVQARTRPSRRPPCMHCGKASLRVKARFFLSGRRSTVTNGQLHKITYRLFAQVLPVPQYLFGTNVCICIATRL